jgi:hypothetical protein
MEPELVSTEEVMQHPAGTAPEEVPEMSAEYRQLSSGRHRHVPLAALAARNVAQIRIRSDQLTYRLLLGLLDGNRYVQHPARHLAEYLQTLSKGRGSVSLAFSPRSNESWEQVLLSLQLLGDELVDTFLVLLAVALDTNGTKHITLPFSITADDILVICQKKKSKGSYTARQRLQVSEHIWVLTRVCVQADLALRDEQQWHVESPLLEVLMSERDEEEQLSPGDKDQSSWQLKIGEWAASIPQLQSQTSVMSRQILRYHARKQKYEKRLGRYLTVLYRINAHRHEGCVRVSMGVLLEHAGIGLDRDNPGRTRVAVEDALKQLQADGVIGSFRPIGAHSPCDQEIQERIEQHAYHWWDDYRRQIWLFTPPASLKTM